LTKCVSGGATASEWTGVFGSERLTGALLDRLTHHVHILELTNTAIDGLSGKASADSTDFGAGSERTAASSCSVVRTGPTKR